MKFVAPMPEQIATTTIRFLKASPGTSGKCIVGAQLVLAWVQLISVFWSSDDRLNWTICRQLKICDCRDTIDNSSTGYLAITQFCYANLLISYQQAG